MRAPSLALFCFLLAGIPVTSYGQETIETVLTDFIKTFNGRNREIKVYFSHLPSHLKGSVKVGHVSFSKLPDANGEGVCMVETKHAGGSRQSYVPFRIFRNKALFVLAHSLKKGDRIGAADLHVKETLISGTGAGYPESRYEAEGRIVRKDLPAGTVLTNSLLEEEVLVQRGDIVTMEVSRGNLLVKTKGKSLEQGRAGDVIRVKNVTSGKEVTAKVRSNDAVVVEF